MVPTVFQWTVTLPLHPTLGFRTQLLETSIIICAHFILPASSDGMLAAPYSKGTVVPVLLTEHHAMKAYWESGDIAPCILDLGTRREWVASRPGRFTPPRERAPSTNWIGASGKEKNSQPCLWMFKVVVKFKDSRMHISRWIQCRLYNGN
jgi:hypothetical protein